MENITHERNQLIIKFQVGLSILSEDLYFFEASVWNMSLCQI